MDSFFFLLLCIDYWYFPIGALVKDLIISFIVAYFETLLLDLTFMLNLFR